MFDCASSSWHKLKYKLDATSWYFKLFHTYIYIYIYSFIHFNSTKYIPH